MRQLVCLFALSATLAAADNLIVNGDFSSTEKATDGAFFGWQKGDPAHLGVVAEGKQQFARNADGHHVNTYQEIAIKPEWKAFEISACIRVRNLVRTGAEAWMVPSLQFQAKNAAGEVVGGYSKFMITADQDWTAHKATKEIPADAAKLTVSIDTFDAKGSFDFDDIVVTPILK